MKHTIAVIVENKSGVLTRIAGLFSRRSFNIDSLSVGATDNPDYSRMTITVQGDRDVLEQVIKQLSKLINVIRVSELEPGESVERELAIIKVSADKESRSEIMQIVNIFRAKIIDVSHQVHDHRGYGRRGEDRCHCSTAAPVRHKGDGPHRKGIDGEGREGNQGLIRLNRLDSDSRLPAKEAGEVSNPLFSRLL